jgi:hypothetical protein
MLKPTHLFRAAQTVCFTVIVLALALTSSSAFAAITFSQDFDSGSLNVGGTTVNMSNPLAPAISVAPRYNFQSGWGWFYFQASGVSGLTPQFSNPGSTGFTNENRWVYSYDQQNWHLFDNGTSTPSTYYFSNSTPFTQNSVYVAQVVPYPVSRTDSWVAAAKSNPYVLPTASSNANLVLGRTLGTAGGGYYDDSGRVVAAQNLYSFKLTDPSVPSANKKKIVLTTGNHAGESTGTWEFEGLVNFLMGSDPVAVSLRRKAEFYVYPQSCPEGRAAGYWYSSPEAPASSHNRSWNNPVGLTDVRLVTQAMKADTGSNVEYFFDFHESAAPHLVEVTFPTNITGTPFLSALHTLIPQLNMFAWDYGAGYSEMWAASSAGLNAKYSITPEIGMLVETPLMDAPRAYGVDFALALDQVITPEPGILSLFTLGSLALLRKRRTGSR